MIHVYHISLNECSLTSKTSKTSVAWWFFETLFFLSTNLENNHFWPSAQRGKHGIWNQKKTENYRFWNHACVSTNKTCEASYLFSYQGDFFQTVTKKKIGKALREHRSYQRQIIHLGFKSTRFVVAWQNPLMNVGPWWWKASPIVSWSVLSPWFKAYDTTIQVYKISMQSVDKVLSNVAHKQTNKRYQKHTQK